MSEWKKSSYSNPTGCCVEWRKSSYSSTGGCVEWRTASYSADQGNCLEWRTSSYSMGNGDCIEVAPGVRVRDSKLGDASPELAFPAAAWAAFTAGLRRQLCGCCGMTRPR